MKKLLLILLLNSSCYAQSSYKDAYNAILKASYRQTGLNTMVNDYGKKLETKYVPKTVRDNGAIILILYKIIATQEIKYKWTFK